MFNSLLIFCGFMEEAVIGGCAPRFPASKTTDDIVRELEEQTEVITSELSDPQYRRALQALLYRNPQKLSEWVTKARIAPEVMGKIVETLEKYHLVDRSKNGNSYTWSINANGGRVLKAFDYLHDAVLRVI
jgi:predicted transcriptional regulator